MLSIIIIQSHSVYFALLVSLPFRSPFDLSSGGMVMVTGLNAVTSAVSCCWWRLSAYSCVCLSLYRRTSVISCLILFIAAQFLSLSSRSLSYSYLLWTSQLQRTSHDFCNQPIRSLMIRRGWTEFFCVVEGFWCLCMYI